MIIRLGRLTPGYFRLLQSAIGRPLTLSLVLQRQVAGEVRTQPQDRAVNQLAMMLAIMGLSLSYYSAKQMTEDVPAPPPP
ncbi:putative transmembrane protein ZNF593OS [Pungitius pungitius]|uniref:putative transmembrane protein ZNF593OS n=1 Tax=Pungitius pungitius TaxID=134920 RepID=UPI002E0F3FA1